MPSGFLEVTPRNFNAMSVPGLTQEAGDGVNAALKAMSTWRNEIADTNEKNGKRVIEKMAEAAAALGWPEQVVDAARTQLQKHCRNSDQNNGSTDGRLGGANQIAEPDVRFAIGDVIQAKIFARPCLSR